MQTALAANPCFQLQGHAIGDAGHSCSLSLICCVANGCVLGTGFLGPNPGWTCNPLNLEYTNILLCTNGGCGSVVGTPQYTLTITP
jgi:hypothetical protein